MMQIRTHILKTPSPEFDNFVKGRRYILQQCFMAYVDRSLALNNEVIFRDDNYIELLGEHNVGSIQYNSQIIETSFSSFNEEFRTAAQLQGIDLPVRCYHDLYFTGGEAVRVIGVGEVRPHILGTNYLTKSY